MPCTNLTGNAGLFLHRRKAELLDPLRKVSDSLNSLSEGIILNLDKTCIPQVHLYIDPREKVTARYQVLSAFHKLIVSLMYCLWPNLPVRLLLLAHLSIKERGHDIWKPEAGWDAVTKSPKGLGLAHCYTV